MRTRTKAAALLLFGVMLGCGAIAELVLALHPDVLPREALAIPFMAAHKTSLGLRAWLVASNVAILTYAIIIGSSARTMLAGLTPPWRRLRAAAAVLALTTIAGMAISCSYLLPIEGPASLAMLASVIGASSVLLVACIATLVLATRAQRQTF